MIVGMLAKAENNIRQGYTQDHTQIPPLTLIMIASNKNCWVTSLFLAPMERRKPISFDSLEY